MSGLSQDEPAAVHPLPTLWVALASDHSGTFGRLLVVERFEDVAVVMFDLELLEELEIFLAERFAAHGVLPGLERQVYAMRALGQAP